MIFGFGSWASLVGPGVQLGIARLAGLAPCDGTVRALESACGGCPFALVERWELDHQRDGVG